MIYVNFVNSTKYCLELTFINCLDPIEGYAIVIQCYSLPDYLFVVTCPSTKLHLQGDTGKMSASDPNSAIYVTDSAKDIKNKVLL